MVIHGLKYYEFRICAGQYIDNDIPVTPFSLSDIVSDINKIAIFILIPVMSLLYIRHHKKMKNP
jgi:hypothetical protein